GPSFTPSKTGPARSAKKKSSSSNDGDGLDLHMGVLGQLDHLDRAPGRRVGREELFVSLVHKFKIAQIRHKNSDFHHLLQAGARRSQDGPEVLKADLSLVADAPA